LIDVGKIKQMNKATANTEKAIDKTLLFVDESNKRIEKMPAQNIPASGIKHSLNQKPD
jgi:hypothetical protein